MLKNPFVAFSCRWWIYYGNYYGKDTRPETNKKHYNNLFFATFISIAQYTFMGLATPGNLRIKNAYGSGRVYGGNVEPLIPVSLIRKHISIRRIPTTIPINHLATQQLLHVHRAHCTCTKPFVPRSLWINFII